MKKKLLFASALLMYGAGITQIVPIGAGQGTNSIEYWSRSGNSSGGSNNNIFGTIWNSPIYTVTGGISSAAVRMKVNGFFTSPIDQYSINNYGWNQFVNTTGYLGLGTNSSIGTNQYLWSQKGAYSLLHLNGRDGSVVQEAGYRPWMKTGITFTDNNDLSYMGLRKVGSGFDITETVIGWADNQGTGVGPDCVAFRFFGGGNGSNAISTNLLETNDLDGLHIAQFAPTGEFGLGNTFGVNAPSTPAGLYVRPQSLMHLSLDNDKQVWSQYTNQAVGQTADDGLRIGVANPSGTSNGYIRWQENSSLILQTEWDNALGGINNGERMRVTSVGYWLI